MRFIDLTCKTFGKLTVIGLDRKENGKYYWKCMCLCGNDNPRIVEGRLLRNGKVTHCGCDKCRPSNFKDLTGMTFGNLTVKEEYRGKDKDRVHWICECNCEDKTEMIVSTSNLTSGHTTKCVRCCARATSERCLIDLTGQRFGRLVVTGRAPNYISPNGNTNTMWYCHCDCGNDTVVPQSGLRSQGTVSCGCYRIEVTSERMLEDLSGQRFGMLTVVDRGENVYHPNGGYSVAWNCVCDCGGSVTVQSGNLKNGHTQSCGCISSRGESVIKQYLITNRINYEPQYRFEDCVDVGLLRFDFGVLGDNGELLFLCEYDGQQHFEPVIFGNFSYDVAVEKYNDLVRRDNIKNEYCENNHIALIRIPYWEYDNIEKILSEYINNKEYIRQDM